jgi:hypothetical protein
MENAVKGKYQENGIFPLSDTTARLWLPNLGGLSTWWQQKHTQDWKVYITILY